MKWLSTKIHKGLRPATDDSFHLTYKDHTVAFLDSLKKTLGDAKDSLSNEINKYRSKDLMQAIVAGSTLIAYADGEISPAEKQKLVGYFRNSDQLKVFDTDKVIEAFNGFVGKFEFDRTIATGEVLQKITVFKGKPEAQLIVRVCQAIALADGSLAVAEEKALGEVCTALGLNTKDFI